MSSPGAQPQAAAGAAYVGLLRLSYPDETVRRVRRDVVDRMIEMASAGSPKPASVIPALVIRTNWAFACRSATLPAPRCGMA